MQLYNSNREIVEISQRYLFVFRTRRSVWEEHFRKMERLRAKERREFCPWETAAQRRRLATIYLTFSSCCFLPAHVSSRSSKLLLVLLVFLTRVRDALLRLSRNLLGLRYLGKGKKPVSFLYETRKRAREGKKEEIKYDSLSQ